MNNRQSERGAVAWKIRVTRPGRIRFLAAAAVVAMLVSGTVVGHSADAAFADDYPSWNDVQAARTNTAAAAKQIAEITATIAGLQADVTAKQSLAEQKGEDAQVAQDKYDTKALEAATLKEQADVAKDKAAKSKQQAAQVAARLARTSGNDLPTQIFFSGGKANDMLEQLGLASMVSDQSAGLYAKAIQDQNTAQSLTDTANVAKDALKSLAEAAQKALEEAATAAQAAQAALDEQQAHIATLQAQLETLKTNQQHTEEEYKAGLVAKYGPGADLAAGEISEQGYARPAGGPISSPYGFRVDPYTHNYALHDGTDLGAACGSPIYAAHAGTIVYAGPFGGYGNYIKIDHHDGTFTAYGHIVNGGILVSIGQDVAPGQNIAKIGSTGWSTGCHLHFSVYQGSGTIDPVPFLRDRGISLAGNGG
ncbi:peptidoglycan DD-metalloendopeptidase family protein [Lacisediminihabitans changchengi]|uniref:Peptidoglycan DD-metalloendopeptidase family protein n=1 Tax=Lacisediminihabitans changchengi TaxID=2787634 RepID=A0A934SNC8_9MICO|nr:M23 family metallopeptidase [Lacisediminihabitans changchengi]MBK4348489.1 peptidoglycan DD-metalloendopeptidase family protein [Lacisediminihabitans changchengi]